jgi:hypothetical protein
MADFDKMPDGLNLGMKIDTLQNVVGLDACVPRFAKRYYAQFELVIG